jgi:hypothetical protein
MFRIDAGRTGELRVCADAGIRETSGVVQGPHLRKRMFRPLDRPTRITRVCYP